MELDTLENDCIIQILSCKCILSDKLNFCSDNLDQINYLIIYPFQLGFEQSLPSNLLLIQSEIQPNTFQTIPRMNFILQTRGKSLRKGLKIKINVSKLVLTCGNFTQASNKNQFENLLQFKLQSKRQESESTKEFYSKKRLRSLCKHVREFGTEK